MKHGFDVRKSAVLVASGVLLSRTPEVQTVVADGKTVLLDLETSRFYGLNDVAARVWQLLANPRTLDQLAEALVAEYETPPLTLRRDIATLLQRMRAMGLVRNASDRD